MAFQPMQYSGPAAIIYGGKVCLETNNSSLDANPNNNSVLTQHLGFAGHTAGALIVSIKVKEAVPANGLQIDWVAIARAQKPVTIGYRFGGKTYWCTGHIKNASFTSSVNSNNEFSWEFEGRFDS